MNRKQLKTAFAVAKEIAKESDCVARKVGAVIFKNGAVISSGYNHSVGKPCSQVFPLGADDKGAKRAHKAWSAVYETHAEVDCLGRCMANHVDMRGGEMVVTYAPCAQCAQSIIAAGISAVYFVPELDPRKIGRKGHGAMLLFNAGVEVKLLTPKGLLVLGDDHVAVAREMREACESELREACGWDNVKGEGKCRRS